MIHEQIFIDDLTTQLVSTHKQSVELVERIKQIPITVESDCEVKFEERVIEEAIPVGTPYYVSLMNTEAGRRDLRDFLPDEYYNQVMEVWGDTPLVEEPQWEEPEPMPITPTETQILGQQITDLEISDIIQGQMITDLEIQILMMGVK